jgi:hypothetical protein
MTRGIKYKNDGSGWFNESKRHSLARQGIKTGRKLNLSIAQMSHQKPKVSGRVRKFGHLHTFGVIVRPDTDTDKDGLTNEFDCKPFDKDLQGRVHDFFTSLINHHAKTEPLGTMTRKGQIDNAKRELKQVGTVQHLKDWWKKYHSLFLALGIIAVTSVAIELTGGIGVLMLSAETGETAIVGGSEIARILAGFRSVGTKLPITEAQKDKVIQFETWVAEKIVERIPR